MSCVVHVENAPQERRILFGMFGGKDREMRIREAYHIKDPSCSTGLAAIIEYEKMSSVSTAISAWDGRAQHTNGPPLKVQEVNLEFYCSILKNLYDKDIALRELQQEYDKLRKTLLRKTLHAELPKGPRAMTSPKPVEKTSHSHSKSPSRPSQEPVPRPFRQNSLPTLFGSQKTNTETHIPSRENGHRHEIALGDLFPEILAAFEHVQEIAENGYEDPSHDVGRPLSRIVVKDVNHGSVFLRRGDEQKIISSLNGESRHKKRKSHEEPQTNVFHTYSNGWIGKPAPFAVLPISIDPYTATRKFSHPTSTPATTWQTTWQTPTPIPADPSRTSQKSLGADIGRVSASEAFLREYIEGQAKDKDRGTRWRALGYPQNLA